MKKTNLIYVVKSAALFMTLAIVVLAFAACGTMLTGEYEVPYYDVDGVYEERVTIEKLSQDEGILTIEELKNNRVNDFNEFEWRLCDDVLIIYESDSNYKVFALVDKGNIVPVYSGYINGTGISIANQISENKRLAFKEYGIYVGAVSGTSKFSLSTDNYDFYKDGTWENAYGSVGTYTIENNIVYLRNFGEEQIRTRFYIYDGQYLIDPCDYVLVKKGSSGLFS